MSAPCPAGSVCLPPADISPAQVRQAADRIVHERQFRAAHPSWIARADSWIAARFNQLFHYIFTHGQFTIGGIIVVAAILVIVVLLVARFARNVTRDAGIDVMQRRAVRRSAAEWAAEAVLHEQAGEWREALRCRYRALVVELAERGAVEEIPGRTAREYVALVKRAAPQIATAFDEASGLFEKAWYGSRTASEADYARFNELAVAVLSHLGRARPAELVPA